MVQTRWTIDCTTGTNCTYTPPLGFTGTDTFTITDPTGGTDTATATIQVCDPSGACSTAQLVIRVAQATAGSGGQGILAFTGGSTWRLLGIALVLIAIGFGLTVLTAWSRWKRRSTTS